MSIDDVDLQVLLLEALDHSEPLDDEDVVVVP